MEEIRESVYRCGEYEIKIGDRIMIMDGMTQERLGPAIFSKVGILDPFDLKTPIFKMESDDTEIWGCECWWVPLNVHEDAVAQVKRERQEQAQQES